MRLHRLAFAAIGPFADEHVIDFDALGDGALFLIDGPTGAGKSTVIDALVFALYGDVAGATDKERLRSDFADAATESFCEVDFSVAGGRLRVRRTPAYERAKRRGSGTTQVASSVAVWRHAGGGAWEPVSGSKGEADAAVQQAVGLSRAQFVQTVVLPQGEFAAFLRAESGDRLPMLERIFATGVYRRVQERLDEARREAERRVAQAADEVEAALQRTAGVLAGTQWHDPVRAWLDEPGLHDADRWGGWLASIAEAVEIARAEALSAHRAADAELAGAQSALEAAGVAVERQRRLRAAQEREAACRVAAEGSAAGLEDLPGADLDAKRALVQEQIDGLQEVLGLEKALPEARSAVQAHEKRLVALANESDALRRQRDVELPATVAGLAALLRRRLSEAHEAMASAESVLDDMRVRRMRGIAGELAQGLAPGTPCPVCGGTDHPHPASPHPDHVEPQQIEQQERAVDRLRRAQADEANAVAGAQAIAARMAEVEAQVVADPRSSAEIAAEVAGAAQRFAEVDTGLAAAQSEASGVEQRIVDARSELARQEATVADARGPFGSVAERIAELEASRTRVDQARLAATRLEEATEAVIAAQLDAADADVPTEQAMQALTARRDEAGGQAKAAASALEQIERLARSFADARTDVDAAFAEAARLAASAAPLLRVARALNGAGGGVSLSTFAVQQVFDEVVSAANARLRTMLDGRFQLVTTEERTGARRVDQGLGLKVRDLATETERRTATLSGGESFCASLALALGLADTVRAHAGGVEIDTLLVDEGFGSLDTDRLGDVMEELMRLRTSGRTIGLISHVTEMKQSVAERIDVRPRTSGGGSTLRVNWMDR